VLSPGARGLNSVGKVHMETFIPSSMWRNFCRSWLQVRAAGLRGRSAHAATSQARGLRAGYTGWLRASVDGALGVRMGPDVACERATGSTARELAVHRSPHDKDSPGHR